MALASVKHRYHPPVTGEAIEDLRVRLRLIAATSGDGPGYNTADKYAVGAEWWERPDTSGVVTFDNVAPNEGNSSDVITNPAGSRYGIMPYRQTTNGLEALWDDEEVILVPDSAGPHWVTSILDTMPTDLPSTAAVTGQQLRRQLALNPDNLVSGSGWATDDPTFPDLVTSAPVVWPDGVTGTYTVLVVNTTTSPGSVDSYQVTYGSPATETYTQPAVTRDSDGNVTDRPAITVT